MKRVLPAVFLLLAIAGCLEKEPTRIETLELFGVLQRTTNEHFSASGFAIGTGLGIASGDIALGSAYGVVYGTAMAEGCVSYITVEDRVIKRHETPDFCDKTKTGQIVKVTKIVRMRVRDDKVLNTTYK